MTPEDPPTTYAAQAIPGSEFLSRLLEPHNGQIDPSGGVPHPPVG